MLTRQLPAVALVAVALLAATALATASSGAPATAAATAKTIASTTTSDFRAVVIAERRPGGGGAPEAGITVATFDRAAGRWRRTDARELRGTYFWHSVTGPRAVCRLELRTQRRARLLVQLLVSPSLGCGPVSEVALG